MSLKEAVEWSLFAFVFGAVPSSIFVAPLLALDWAYDRADREGIPVTWDNPIDPTAAEWLKALGLMVPLLSLCHCAVVVLIVWLAKGAHP